MQIGAGLDKKTEKILSEIDMNMDRFVEICDKFTNKKIFKTDETGQLIKDNQLNLQKINLDN